MTADREAAILPLARKLVGATDNAERNAILGDLYNAIAPELAAAHSKAELLREEGDVFLANVKRLETELADARALLLDIEGTIIAYWTDIPETELERLRLRIREVVDGKQS